MRKHGVDTRYVNKTKDGRPGVYYLETGANQRPSLVVYDRADSAPEAMKAAKNNGANNYRKKLWKYGKTAVEVMRVLTSYADVSLKNVSVNVQPDHLVEKY